MISIALLKYGYFARAVAFEPAPISYRLLARNIEQNGLGNRIRHFPYALSSAGGELEMELSEDNSGDNRIRHARVPGAFREERRRTVKVPVNTLDQVFRENPELNPGTVTAIWLDIQGHEAQFFEGARELLRRAVPVVTEFWPYAILRSGMSREAFGQTVAGLFTHLYLLHDPEHRKRPIAEIDELFDAFSAPRQMCQIVLVRDQ
jgi:FkbM family methyltransferase